MDAKESFKRHQNANRFLNHKYLIFRIICQFLMVNHELVFVTTLVCQVEQKSILQSSRSPLGQDETGADAARMSKDLSNPIPSSKLYHMTRCTALQMN